MKTLARLCFALALLSAPAGATIVQALDLEGEDVDIAGWRVSDKLDDDVDRAYVFPIDTMIGPGETTLQRMPWAPSTWAWPSVQLVTAALKAL